MAIELKMRPYNLKKDPIKWNDERITILTCGSYEIKAPSGRKHIIEFDDDGNLILPEYGFNTGETKKKFVLKKQC